MKKIVCVLFILVCCISRASAGGPSTVWTGDVGIQKSRYEYREPGLMSLAGERTSLVGTLTATFYEKMFVRGELLSSNTHLQYESNNTGTMNSVPDTITEARAVVGTIFMMSPRITLSPYFGVGLRRLDNCIAGMTTSTGALAYRRNSEYQYAPVGVSMRIAVGEGGWVIVPTAEKTVFFRGTQTSYLSEVLPLGNAVNKQTSGSGYRMSLAVEHGRWSFSSWVRSWDVEDSEVVQVSYGYWGMMTYGIKEPRNKTKEVGIGVKYKLYY